MRKKVVVSLLVLLALGSLASALSSMTTQASGMGVDWTARLSSGTNTPAPTPAPLTIASNVQAVYQGDATAGWDSQQQYSAWWPSACSVFALYEVLKAWGVQSTQGKPLTPGTVLDQEIQAGVITEANGLISLEGYANLVPQDYQGLDTTYFNHLTLAHLQALTAAGYAVQVNIWDPDGRYYPFQPGHWLVVVAHSSQGYAVRDSSGLHLTLMSDQAFNYEFTQRAVVVRQEGAKLP